MGWLFVPGSEDWSTDSESPSMDTELWLHVSGKPVQRPFSRALKMRPEIAFLSGTILAPSMAEDGAEALILSVLASLANRSRQRGSGTGSPTSVGSGLPQGESFATFDLASSLWRTSSDLFSMDSTPYSARWPNSGSMRSGTCSAQPESERLTAVAGSSFSRGEYPTPAASRSGSSQNEGKVAHKRPTNGTPSLDTWAKTWPTPRTPTGGAESATRKQELGRTESGGGDLQAAAKQWPTPAARDEKGANAKPYRDRGGGKKGEQLPNYVAHLWPTVTATDAKAGGSRNTANSSAHAGVSLTDMVKTGDSTGRQDRTTVNDGETTSPQGDRTRLNPRFAEALMGLPVGLTSCALSATGFARWLQHMRSALWRGEEGLHDETGK